MIHLAPMILCVLPVGDTSPEFSETPSRFYNNLFIVDVHDREGTRHRMLIDSGSPRTCFYPSPKLKQTAPVLFIRAGRDQRINAEVEAKFKEAMATAKKPLEVKAYDAGHGFANPSNPIYDKAAADDAHALELAFFKKHLG